MYHKNNFKFKYIVIINYLIYIFMTKLNNFFNLIFKNNKDICITLNY